MVSHSSKQYSLDARTLTQESESMQDPMTHTKHLLHSWTILSKTIMATVKMLSM